MTENRLSSNFIDASLDNLLGSPASSYGTLNGPFSRTFGNNASASFFTPSNNNGSPTNFYNHGQQQQQQQHASNISLDSLGPFSYPGNGWLSSLSTHPHYDFITSYHNQEDDIKGLTPPSPMTAGITTIINNRSKSPPDFDSATDDDLPDFSTTPERVHSFDLSLDAPSTSDDEIIICHPVSSSDYESYKEICKSKENSLNVSKGSVGHSYGMTHTCCDANGCDSHNDYNHGK